MDVLTINRRLGHASPTITLGVYGQFFSNTDDCAAAVMETGFGRALTEQSAAATRIRTTGMDGLVDLKKAIEEDVARYERMRENFRSGMAKTGERGDQGRLNDKTPSAIAHLETIVRELRAILSSDG